MLKATEKILELFDNDEFKIFIVTGDHGYGKSAYCNRVLAEVYSLRRQETYQGDGIHSNWNIKVFQDHLGFLPKHVLNLWKSKRKRDLAFHWDDAGLWLSSSSHYDPFVKEVGNYLQVARSRWSCIMFSCISHHDIVKKIRVLKGAILINITKYGAGKDHKYRRTATAKQYWESLHGKSGYKNLWEDTYSCKMPDKYFIWYNERRERYTDMAHRLMLEKLKKKQDLWDIDIDL